MSALTSDAPGAAEKEGETFEPDMALAQTVFRQGREPTDAAKAEIMAAIEKGQMAPYYEHVCGALGWPVDEALLRTMKDANAEELETLREKKEDAEKNQGDMEVLDALFDEVRFQARIGAKEASFAACDAIRDRPKISTGKRIDALMAKIRVSLFFVDVAACKAQLQEAKDLAKDGGDWDRNNRLSVYEAAYQLVTRDVKQAAEQLQKGIATFTCVELCAYPEFVFYAVVTNVLTLPRPELKKKIVDAPEVLQVIKQMPHLATLVTALYNCEYAKFFAALPELELLLLKDRYLSRHTRYLVRELRVLVYTQFLEAYQTVTLASMAAAFGISVAFCDAELERFIACGRLNAKVDKVANVVETTRADYKSKKYQDLIKSGDVLLNRIQQLARCVAI
mmetsp:Transcript_17486/g.52095  ORF Transcript_17486/g.52095 Transcript_17486/m.52095 type:complete len:394 (-) Transcript_17486:39-1220(-)